MIKGYSAYLPLLEECTKFISASGEVLRVTKSPDGSFQINNAKILSTNIILENGVAYIIDRVSHTAYILTQNLSSSVTDLNTTGAHGTE